MTCTDTGWSWDQVGRLTLRQHRALYRRFNRQPPVHWLLAAFIGFKPPREEHAGETGDAIDVRALLDALPGEDGRPKALTLDMLSLLAMM